MQVVDDSEALMDQCPLRAKLQDVLISSYSNIVVLFFFCRLGFLEVTFDLFLSRGTRAAAALPRSTKIFPLNKGGGASDSRGREAPKGLSVWRSKTRPDNPLKASPSFPLSEGGFWARPNRIGRPENSKEVARTNAKEDRRGRPILAKPWLQSNTDLETSSLVVNQAGVRMMVERIPTHKKKQGATGQTLPVAPCQLNSSYSIRSSTSTQTEFDAPGRSQRSVPDSASRNSWLGC